LGRASRKSIRPCKSSDFDADGFSEGTGGFCSLFSPTLDISGNGGVVFALSEVPSQKAFFALEFEGGEGARSLDILTCTPVSDGAWDIYTVPRGVSTDGDLSAVSAIGFRHPFDNATHDESLGHHVASEIPIDDIRFE
jgi:hypothetical protein